jgi:uncharacterized protein
MAIIDAVDIPAPHGILEGLLRHDGPGSSVAMAALVCHPHPMGGGTMHNKVVFTIAKALSEAGIPSLRFNFRGVGRSTGAYDEGRGEADDTRTALDWLAARYPDTPLLLAGFSFGSWVGLPIGCADPRVTRIIGVGVPTTLLQIASLTNCAKPKLIVQGEQDQYGPLASLRPWYDALPEPKTLRVIPGTDHFITGHQNELDAAIREWLAVGGA